MKTRILAGLGLLLVLAAPLLLVGQGAERLTTKVLMAVSASHGTQLAEKLPGEIGIVEATGRHCAKYAHDGVIDFAACNADPSTTFSHSVTHNSRTNAGRDWQKAQMGGTPGAACTWIASSNDGSTPAADGSNSDTTLAGEITFSTSGLRRTDGPAVSYAAGSAGANTYTLSKTFTGGAGCPGTPGATTGCTFQRAALFTANSAGTMCFETAPFAPITLNSTSDTATFNWQITF